MWKALCSRKLALYALLALVVPLIASTLLPSEITLSEQQWDALQRENPLYFQLASRCATPYIVKTPYFSAVSALLFLSTFACTWQRVRTWLATRNSDFSKEKSFSFSREVALDCDATAAQRRIEHLLASSGWKRCDGASGLAIAADKGRSGFWGSVIFHGGLLCCLLAGPVTLLTGVSGELVLTEGVELPLADAVAAPGRPAALPKASVLVHDLRGRFFQGQFKTDFSGTLTLRDGKGTRELPFAVNKPADYQGVQFSLHQFGFAPRVVLETPQAPPFDFYLNLRHPDRGDYFEMGGGLRALVMFFPDFIQEGKKIGSKSREPVNPVTMIKLFRGDQEVFKGLFRPGEEQVWEGRRIRIPDYRQWVTLNVTKEQGVLLIVIGSVVGAAGLLIRFLSNERRIEFEIVPLGGRSGFKVRGYSRYYPAFLEKEVLEIAKKLEQGEQSLAKAGIGSPERSAGCEVV